MFQGNQGYIERFYFKKGKKKKEEDEGGGGEEQEEKEKEKEELGFLVSLQFMGSWLVKPSQAAQVSRSLQFPG